MSNIDWQALPKKERRRLKRELEKLEQAQEKGKSKLIKWGFLLGTIVILVGGFFLFSFWEKKRFENAPRLEMVPATFDFGKVSPKEGKKETSFTIKNSGVSPLTLLGAKTSCDCTTAQFKIGESQSPIFGMHDSPNWSATLKPGEKAEMEVYYDPAVHPVLGPITRTVSIFSNDPTTPEKKITVYAEVTP